MRNSIRRFGLPFFALLTGSLYAAPVSSCDAYLTACNVYEGQTLTYPDGFFGYSGDLVIQSPPGSTVDVFRVFNDLLDTGGGTGLGLTAFLFGADIKDLPDPATYSLNVVTIPRGTHGPQGYYETDYNGNGTAYSIFTPSPEPSEAALIGLAVLCAGPVWRRKSRQRREC